MEKLPLSVRIWLTAGLVMVFMQIVIGGITRLTDSGLSITEWEVVKGTLPPMGEAAWEEAFQKYKDHTVQFEQLGKVRTLSDFKFIYFWEWFHRLWARTIGFVFLFPFIWFVFRKQLSGALMRRLGFVVLGAATAAVFGWIMVKSGLNTEYYAWVNPYKLVMHLSIALVVYGLLLWINFMAWRPSVPHINAPSDKRWIWSLVALTCVQIVFGGLMSGLKAGLAYPQFPDYAGQVVPHILFDSSQWTVENVVYHKNVFMSALVQFLHRNTAYLLSVLMIYFVIRLGKSSLTPALSSGRWILLGSLGLQVTLGIITLMLCAGGQIPAFWGVLHQAAAIVLLSVTLWVAYQFSEGGSSLVRRS